MLWALPIALSFRWTLTSLAYLLFLGNALDATMWLFK